MNKQGRNDPCACGSGKKYKKCCGAVAGPSATAEATPLSATFEETGLPGNLLHIAVRPEYPKGDPKNVGGPGGLPGDYKVVFTLARPGFSLRPERNFTFSDRMTGDSHVAITRPACTAPLDADRVRFDVQYQGGSYRLFGYPNEKGYLARIELPSVNATNSRAAEEIAYKVVAPLLSGISLLSDIPASIFQIDVTELRTATATLRTTTPFLDTVLPQPATPLESELRGYASVYREAMNSSNPLYQFLCFYKIIEAVRARRDRLSSEAKAQGKVITRPRERIPTDASDVKAWLASLFPKHYPWDKMLLEEIIPAESLGKKTNDVVDKTLRPLRDRIAHSIFESGELTQTVDEMPDLDAVNKWLPLTKCVARLSMKNEFGLSF